MNNNYCSPLDITQIEQNFAEINPAMTVAEAMHEANRCLYCYDAPCTHACPTHRCAVVYQEDRKRQFAGSARVIFDANPIGATCARVCPVEVLCEGACVEKTLLKNRSRSGAFSVMRRITRWMPARQIFTKGEPNGKSVGIVGSGPAGLSCATYLARLGYEVTVYERSEAGGLDTYGMAEYKMPQKRFAGRGRADRAIGVKFMLNTEIVAADDEL